GELLRTLKSREQRSTDPPYSAFLGSSLLDAPAFFDEAKSAIAGQPSLAEGFFGVDGDPAPERATARDLVDLYERYKAAHPDIAADAPLTIDRGIWAEAVILLSLAIEQAGGAGDPAALRDSLI